MTARHARRTPPKVHAARVALAVVVVWSAWAPLGELTGPAVVAALCGLLPTAMRETLTTGPRRPTARRLDDWGGGL